MEKINYFRLIKIDFELKIRINKNNNKKFKKNYPEEEIIFCYQLPFMTPIEINLLKNYFEKEIKNINKLDENLVKRNCKNLIENFLQKYINYYNIESRMKQDELNNSFKNIDKIINKMDKLIEKVDTFLNKK